jgi:hypothetical protein
MRKWLVIPVALAGLLPAQAMAERMSYSYIQLTGLVDTDIKQGGSSESGNSFGARAGWIMGPYVFTDLRYDDLDYGSGIGGHEGEVRLGYRQDLLYQEGSPERLDWYGMVSYEDLKVDSVIDENGYGIHGGLRFSPSQWLP